MGRLKERTPELRDRVLRVAVAMLEEHGVTGFTTRRVAAAAHTSIPAVYELFGGKGGLVREVFFEGFRQLGGRIEELDETTDPRADLEAAIAALRLFVTENPVLAEVMFSRPFGAFGPGPSELEAGRRVRESIVTRVGRCVDAGVLVGDPVDVAHVLVALAQGLAGQQTAGWLGTSRASIDRRWSTGIGAFLDGLQWGGRRPGGR